jgi:hypothetical protein
MTDNNTNKSAFAKSKIEEANSIMKSNISNMAKNVTDVESKLLPESQEISALANRFRKDA